MLIIVKITVCGSVNVDVSQIKAAYCSGNSNVLFLSCEMNHKDKLFVVSNMVRPSTTAYKHLSLVILVTI